MQIAHLLRVELGLNKGDRVVLAYEFGLRFFVVFLGCLRAGIIAVPVYPPNPATLKKSLRKLQGIVDSCTPRMALVGPAVNKLRLASKLKALATGTNDWPDLPYNCPDVPEEDTAAAALFGGWLGGFGNKMDIRPQGRYGDGCEPGAQHRVSYPSYGAGEDAPPRILSHHATIHTFLR